MDKVLNINYMPNKTWYWLKVNGCDVKINEINGKSSKKIITESKVDNKTNDFDTLKSSMGEDFVHLTKDSDTLSYVFKGDETLVIHYDFKDDTISNDVLNLRLLDNANVKVFMVYKSEKDFSGSCMISTRAILGKNAHLKLMQTSLLSYSYTLFNDISVKCDDNAFVENIDVLLGSNKTYSSLLTELVGYKSQLKSDLVYYGNGERNYDFNYVINHYGKKSNSDINVMGILDDKSKKIFRGTIDFKTGSSGSVGAEKEDVLLFGDDSVNKTVPVILCSEEDVKVNHGASIGKIEDDILFYLMSRGLSEENIKELMSKSRIYSKARLFENDDIIKEIDSFLGEK